jgi:hypothetical protein
MGDQRPVLLGYQRARESSPDQLLNDLRLLQAFADREGYALGLVYTAATGTWGAMEHLLSRVRDGEADAVGVPSEADLGGTGKERAFVRSQIEAAGIPLLVAQVL